MTPARLFLALLALLLAVERRHGGACGGSKTTRGENGVLGGVWLDGHGLVVGSEVVGRFSRERGAAPSLQMQSLEPVVASYGAGKTAL